MTQQGFYSFPHCFQVSEWQQGAVILNYFLFSVSVHSFFSPEHQQPTLYIGGQGWQKFIGSHHQSGWQGGGGKSLQVTTSQGGKGGGGGWLGLLQRPVPLALPPATHRPSFNHTFSKTFFLGLVPPNYSFRGIFRVGRKASVNFWFFKLMAYGQQYMICCPKYFIL